MPAVEARITLRLDDMPKALAQLRRELANALRAQGDGEPEFVRRKLESCAAAFETGIREDEADGR